MREEDRCQNGDPDCGFGNEHELALVSELMRVIGSYNETQGVDACPLCLRNTMLAVAALLHLDAARIDQARTDRPRANAKNLGNDLAKAARNALENVTLAKAALFSSHSRN